MIRRHLFLEPPIFCFSECEKKHAANRKHPANRAACSTRSLAEMAGLDPKSPGKCFPKSLRVLLHKTHPLVFILLLNSLSLVTLWVRRTDCAVCFWRLCPSSASFSAANICSLVWSLGRFCGVFIGMLTLLKETWGGRLVCKMDPLK